ncbi:hypothetical protein D3C72_1452670 [compost metagenome]
MACQADAVFNPAQRCADLAQYVAHVGFYQRTAAVKHGPILVVDDLNLQSVGCDVDADLRLVFVQARGFGDQGVDLGLQGLDAVQVLLGALGAGGINAHAALLGLFHIRAPHLPVHLREIVAPARNHTGAVARAVAASHCHLERRREIRGDPLQFALGRGA